VYSYSGITLTVKCAYTHHQTISIAGDRLHAFTLSYIDQVDFMHKVTVPSAT
jgi:hypothetical protein